MSDKKNDLYPNLNTDIVDAKITENKSFQFSLTNLKDIKNFYEDEKIHYKKKLDKYRTYAHVIEVAEIILSSSAPIGTTVGLTLSGVGVVVAAPTVASITVSSLSLSKVINNKLQQKIRKYLKMYVMSQNYSSKFNDLYKKANEDNKIDKKEYDQLVNNCEEYKKHKTKIKKETSFF